MPAVIRQDSYYRLLDTLRPAQNGRHFEDETKCIDLGESVWICIKSSLQLISNGAIDN